MANYEDRFGVDFNEGKLSPEDEFRVRQEEIARGLSDKELERRIENCRGYSESPYSESPSFGEIFSEILTLFTRKPTFREMDMISSGVYRIELNRREH